MTMLKTIKHIGKKYQLFNEHANLNTKIHRFSKTRIFLLVATKCGGILELSDISLIEINLYLLLPNAVFVTQVMYFSYNFLPLSRI